MVNLESAITERGAPDAKELEVPGERYWFRTSPTALDVLAAAGVDVVTVANNHGADYGPVGLRDTLRAAAHGPVAVVGVGRDRQAAFAPYRDDRPRHRLRLPRRRRLDARGYEQRLGRRATTPGHRRGPRRRGRGAPRRRPGGRAARTTSSWSTCTGVAELQSCPTAGSSTHRAGPGRRRSRRRRGQPRPRPAGIGLAGRHLCRLRPGQLRLVPRPPARDRCPPAAHRGREVVSDDLGARPGSSRGAARSRSPAGAAPRPSRTGAAGWLRRPRAAPRHRPSQPPPAGYSVLGATHRAGAGRPDGDQPRRRLPASPGGPALPTDELRRLRRPGPHRRDGRGGAAMPMGRARLRAAVRRPVADPADAAGRRLRRRRRPLDGGRQHLGATTAAESPAARPGLRTPTAPPSTSTPCENPYLTAARSRRRPGALRRTRPVPGRRVAARRDPRRCVVVRAFADIGWEWGGYVVDRPTTSTSRHRSARWVAEPVEAPA